MSRKRRRSKVANSISANSKQERCRTPWNIQHGWTGSCLDRKFCPQIPCMIGDAQPDLIKILLLQMGVNLHILIKHFHRNFCGKIETVWQHFQKNKTLRIDLDPKVPYLGEDDDGNLIETTDDHMKELYYHRVGNPNCKEDIGEQGFVNAYHGSLIFKKLIIYLLECGYGSNDLRDMFGGEQFEGFKKSDTPEEEAKKTLRARDSLEIQATFIRRVLAGAYGVNAVYFFRNVNYLNTVTLWMPTTSTTHRSNAFDPAKRQTTPKTIDHQTLRRDRWVQQFKAARRSASEAGATYDGSPRSGDRRHTSSSRFDSEDSSDCESEGKGEASTQTTSKTKHYSKLKIYILHIISTSSRACSWAETATNTTTRTVEKITAKVAAATHIAAVIGTTLDMETGVGDYPEWPLHRSRWLATSGNQCSWLNSTSLRMTFGRNLSRLILCFRYDVICATTMHSEMNSVAVSLLMKGRECKILTL